MKKILLAAVAAFLLISVQNSNAQIGLGAGLAYGTEIETIGIQVGGTYLINENFRAAADIIYFFPKSEGDGDFSMDLNWFEFNANIHYIFFEDESMQAYGLGGLNYARLSIDEPTINIPGVGQIGGGSYSESEIGLNLGIGAMLDIDFAWLYGEAKFTISDFDQLSIAVGLRFSL
jgi:outer membrane immunogenic protein